MFAVVAVIEWGAVIVAAITTLGALVGTIYSVSSQSSKTRTSSKQQHHAIQERLKEILDKQEALDLRLTADKKATDQQLTALSRKVSALESEVKGAKASNDALFQLLADLDRNARARL